MATDADGNVILSPDIVARYQEAYGGSGMFPSYGTYSRDQFHKLTFAEPYPIEWRSVDNPKFLWPSNQYMDTTGTTHKVQRGYMRSLLSDPQVDINKEMKNRRLFFQFNPQVLVRSVQQTPGAMNPLLQDPAQLLAPVPGTTSFGFELMFNREHEVNAGYNDPEVTEDNWLKLPNGDTALISEIGVLADLMILDAITGQGLSQDMINAVVNRQKRQYENINAVNAQVKADMEEAGIEGDTLDYEAIPIPEEQDLKTIFEANFGNSAFLNPQPFRVLFSSLFMVEGIATSVDVVFQKFSRTMVPTQCKVTINMYALYLGFSKDKTFIFDNLRQAAEEQQVVVDNDYKALQKFTEGVRKFNAKLVTSNATVNSETNEPIYDGSFPSRDTPRFEVSGIKISDELKDFLEKNDFTEANFSFDLEWAVSTTANYKYRDATLRENRLTLKQEGTKVNFNAKGTKNVKDLLALKDNDIEKSIFQSPDDLGVQIAGKYITYRVILVIHAISPGGTTIQKDIYGSVVYNAEWVKTDGNNMSQSSTYNYNPPKGGSVADFRRFEEENS